MAGRLEDVPPRRATRAQAQQRTRGALIRSASKVFARRGYHATTVDEIAETAGYSPGAVYSNFSGKEELLQATAEAYVERQAERWARDFEGASDAAARARAPADAWMAAVSEEPEEFLLFMELWAHAARNPALRQSFADRWMAGREFMAAALTAVATEQGFALSDAQRDDVVALLDALGIGLAVRKTIDPSAVPDDLFGRIIAEWLPALLKQRNAANR